MVTIALASQQPRLLRVWASLLLSSCPSTSLWVQDYYYCLVPSTSLIKSVAILLLSSCPQHLSLGTRLLLLSCPQHLAY